MQKKQLLFQICHLAFRVQLSCDIAPKKGRWSDTMERPSSGILFQTINKSMFVRIITSSFLLERVVRVACHLQVEENTVGLTVNEHFDKVHDSACLFCLGKVCRLKDLHHEIPSKIDPGLQKLRTWSLMRMIVRKGEQEGKWTPCSDTFRLFPVFYISGTEPCVILI